MSCCSFYSTTFQRTFQSIKATDIFYNQSKLFTVNYSDKKGITNSKGLLSQRGFLSRERASKIGGKKKSSSSQAWIKRQLTDEYVRKAHAEDLRSRAAYKLLEIDNKYKFLKYGKVVLDLGCCPGGWSAVAVKRTNSDKRFRKKTDKRVGKVISLDKELMEPIEGATFLQTDFTNPETETLINQELGEEYSKFDIVLSDLAVTTRGSGDSQNQMHLCTQVLEFSESVLNYETGCLLIKIFQGSEEGAFRKRLQRNFQFVKAIKPLSSRSESKEIFYFARGFGLVKQKKKVEHHKRLKQDPNEKYIQNEEIDEDLSFDEYAFRKKDFDKQNENKE